MLHVFEFLIVVCMIVIGSGASYALAGWIQRRR